MQTTCLTGGYDYKKSIKKAGQKIGLANHSEHNTDNGNDGSRSSYAHCQGCVIVSWSITGKKLEIFTHGGIVHKFTVRQDQVAKLRMGKKITIHY